MTRIRVLVADDHGIVRAGICSLLQAQEDMQVVDEAANGREAVQKAVQLLPDVVLMDIAMPGMKGLEATREIRRRAPRVRVLALTVQDNEEYFFPMLKAGASGYILKEAHPDDLLSAIRAVHRGGAFLSPAVGRVLLEAYMRKPAPAPPTTLTPREKEILQRAAKGFTNREIAQELCLSIKTVEKHRAAMMEKLGLQGRQALLKYALRQGLIESVEGEE